jgi:hypothetical protein
LTLIFPQGIDSQQFKDLVSVGGYYIAEVIVGGGDVQKPYKWKVANVNLEIQDVAKPKSRYEPEKIIQHIFREPDKRAPEAISSLFTGLCLSPFALFVFLVRILHVVQN